MSDFKTQLKDTRNVDKDTAISIVLSEFNEEYTNKLLQENLDFLHGKWFNNISVYRVPWAFEIPWFAARILEKNNSDLIITLWVVVRWETTHYESVAFESGRWIMELSTRNNTPIIFWVLTCENYDQVEQRIGTSASISGLNLLSEVKRLENV